MWRSLPEKTSGPRTGRGIVPDLERVIVAFDDLNCAELISA
jgi:hypothetical protein